jgi:NAD(P)H dehydrogenase (quinone)
MLSLTTGSGSPEEAYRAGGLHGDLSGILRPIHRGIFQFVGFEVLQPHIVYGPTRMTMEQREAALDLWGERLGRIFQEEEITVGAY